VTIPPDLLDADDESHSVRHVKWLENRWWAARRRAIETGADALALWVHPDVHGRSWYGRNLDDIAHDMDARLVGEHPALS
jgi:hypothetical protein